MVDILRAPFEDGNCHEFQLIDIRILEKEVSPYSFDDVSDLHGDDFISNTCDIEMKYNKNCVVGLFGCTAKGNSIYVRVDGFLPYLFYRVNESVDTLLVKVASLAGIEKDRLKSKSVKRKNLYGWEPNADAHPTDRKEHNYLQVFFPNVFSMKKAIQNAKQLQCHEHQFGADTQFMDSCDVVPSGWVCVQGTRVGKDSKVSHCPIEIVCHMQNVSYVDKSDVAPLMVAAIDIECISESGAFPDASLPRDIVSMISLVLWRVGTPRDQAKRCCYVVGKCDEVEDSYVYTFETEREMLSRFRTDMVTSVDPDVIATYNGFGFDLEYLWTRAEKLGCLDFMYLDRLIVQQSRADKKELSSSALGSNDLFIINMVGRCNLDLFQWVKAREKLESYKLDDVCEHFLGERKIEMDYKELFKMARGTPAEVAIVAKYCIQDSFLLILLMLRLAVFECNIEMSRVCLTPMEALVTRGQQYKVMNQLCHYGHREGRREDGNGGYILNTPAKYSGTADESYEGATVIDAVADYYKKPIAVLDFMSLYPSIMLANNLCYSTIVMDEKYKNVPGVKYETIRVTDTKVYTWAKGMPGLLPIMLDKLLAARKAAKKAMGAAKTDIERGVFNGRQLALKVSANSIYGFTGAVKMGKMHCLGIADTVTWKAREMLNQTVVWVKEFAPCDVVYGDTDSVMVYFHGTKTAEEAFAKGDDAADKITDQFSEKYNTNRIVLEMEKVYLPYLLMRKKRYVGMMYEKNKKGEVVFDHLDAKGVELVRRDNCPLAKRVQTEVCDALMYKMDEDLACKAVHKCMDDLVEDTYSLAEYKMSKSRRKEYKNEDLPHLAVVKKMHARNPGSEPQIGDRVPFVYVETDDYDAKACEASEDPKFVEDSQNIPGLVWKNLGDTKPKEGREIFNERLASALQTRTEFTDAHLESYGTGKIERHDFIWSGTHYFQPTQLKIDRLRYAEKQIIKPTCSLLELVIANPEALFDKHLSHLRRQRHHHASVMSFGTVVANDDVQPSLSSQPLHVPKSKKLKLGEGSKSLMGFVNADSASGGVRLDAVMSIASSAARPSKAGPKKRKP